MRQQLKVRKPPHPALAPSLKPSLTLALSRRERGFAGIGYFADSYKSDL